MCNGHSYNVCNLYKRAIDSMEYILFAKQMKFIPQPTNISSGMCVYACLYLCFCFSSSATLSVFNFIPIQFELHEASFAYVPNLSHYSIIYKARPSLDPPLLLSASCHYVPCAPAPIVSYLVKRTQWNLVPI